MAAGLQALEKQPGEVFRIRVVHVLPVVPVQGAKDEPI
jgi:hypothetical protein